MKFFLSVKLSLFILLKIFFRVIFDQHRTTFTFSFQSVCRHLSGNWSEMLTTLRMFMSLNRNPCFRSFLFFWLKFFKKHIRSFLDELWDCIFILTFPKWNIDCKLLNRYCLFIGEYLAFEVNHIILRQVETTTSAKRYNISCWCTIAIRLPELRDWYLLGINEFSYFIHDSLVLEKLTILFRWERVVISLLVKEIHFSIRI